MVYSAKYLLKHWLCAFAMLAVIGPSLAFAQKAVSTNDFPLQKIEITLDDTQSLSLIVEIAQTHAKRAQGLMHREVLTDSQGMLFIWPDRAVRQFWMKNTPLSLDILFFDEFGTLVHLAEAQTPFSERIVTSLMPVQYVLELPAGDTNRYGIELGAKLTHFLP